MIQLIMVRHGETDANKKGTYCGWTDTVLNEQGQKQAAGVGDRLKNEPIDRIYTSPLRRALMTAEIINRPHGVPLVQAEDLKERCFGVWEDMTSEEIMQKYRDAYDLWCQDWIHYRMDQGEAFAEMHQRVVRFIDTLLQNCKEGNIVIVSHQGVIRSILVHLLGMKREDVWRFKVDHGAITRILITKEGYAYLAALNV